MKYFVLSSGPVLFSFSGAGKLASISRADCYLLVLLRPEPVNAPTMGAQAYPASGRLAAWASHLP